MNNKSGPKILVFDIETSPIISYTWGIWDQNIGLNQIKDDWTILSWGAKWYNPKDSTILYQDNRKAKNVRNDKNLLKGIWKLLDKADIVITQNGKQFDQKKLNARFVLHGMQPPSSYKHIDTLQLAKKHFGFTSNKLEYMADKLCTKYKKLKHDKFPGFELWRECLSGNLKAWKEMEKYNKHDVLSLEELYSKLQPWDMAINFNVYYSDTASRCNCGSKSFRRNGYFYSAVGKYQRFRCSECGAEAKNRGNLLTKKKRKSLKVGVPK